jgi:hypothetical protein
MVAGRLAADFGVNVTPIAQVADWLSDDPQVFVNA